MILAKLILKIIYIFNITHIFHTDRIRDLIIIIILESVFSIKFKLSENLNLSHCRTALVVLEGGVQIPPSNTARAV